MEDEPKRPLRAFVRAADRVVNLVTLLIVLLLVLYSGYSIWYTSSLLNGSFLSDELAMYKPNGHEPTLAELMEINKDVRAWLTVDNTHIDYPVVQGEDDNKYLNTTADGQFSLAGAIFVTVQNAPDFSDSYNVIYGHRVEGGAMFADVLEFRDKSYFDAHPTGILWLADRAYAIEVFACLEVDALDKVVYQDPSFVTPEDLPTLVEDVCARATQKRSVSVVPGDHVIALSTCENVSTFERVVLFGKLVPMAEQEMQAAMERNSEEEAAIEASGGRVKPSFLQRYPWVLPLGGACLLLLLLVILYRVLRRR